jgi:hypothetical protein
MRYLITTNILMSGTAPFLTNYFDAENNFNSEIEMVVYNLYLNKYTTDGKNWYEIEIDHL